MANPYLGLGIAEGAKMARQNIESYPERQAQMQEAKERQELSKLRVANAAKTNESKVDLEVQQLKNDLYTAQRQGFQARTFDTFRAYNADGNVKHLNNFLREAKANPVGKNLFADVVRYDPLERSKEAEEAIKRMGITDVEGFFEDTKDVANFVWATDTKGQKQLIDMDQVYIQTGFTSHMQDTELARMNKRSLIHQRMTKGESKANLTALERVAKAKADAEGIPFHQAYEELKKGSSRTAGTETERLAKTLMEQNPELTYIEAYEQAISKKRPGSAEEREARRIAEEEGRDYNEVFEEVKSRNERTTSQKSVDEINQTKDELDKQFDGSFLDADLSTPGARRKAGRFITRIEKDFPLTTEDRRTAVEIRQLRSLGGVAGENITDKEAGPIDSMIRSVKKYLSNDVTGTGGTAAYESFRNTLRHALYGASLTQGEINAFNSAAGSLKEQTGPVLVKLNTQLSELKSKLEAVYDLNDEYVAKYRLNMDLDEVAKVISAIDERIDFFQGVKGPTDTPAVVVPSGERKPLAEYFKR